MQETRLLPSHRGAHGHCEPSLDGLTTDKSDVAMPLLFRIEKHHSNSNINFGHRFYTYSEPEDPADGFLLPLDMLDQVRRELERLRALIAARTLERGEEPDDA